MASPDLWRGERCASFECNLEYKAPVRLMHHLAQRSKATDRVLAHKRSIRRSSSSVKADRVQHGPEAPITLEAAGA